VLDQQATVQDDVGIERASGPGRRFASESGPGVRPAGGRADVMSHLDPGVVNELFAGRAPVLPVAVTGESRRNVGWQRRRLDGVGSVPWFARLHVERLSVGTVGGLCTPATRGRCLTGADRRNERRDGYQNDDRDEAPDG